MAYDQARTPQKKITLQKAISPATRKMLSITKQKGRNPRSRHVTIIAPDGRKGGLPTIREAAAFFGIHQRAMEARIRRSYETGGHPGWPVPGKAGGLYRCYFSDKGDPGNGKHRLDPNTPAPQQPSA